MSGRRDSFRLSSDACATSGLACQASILATAPLCCVLCIIAHGISNQGDCLQSNLLGKPIQTTLFQKHSSKRFSVRGCLNVCIVLELLFVSHLLLSWMNIQFELNWQYSRNFCTLQSGSPQADKICCVCVDNTLVSSKRHSGQPD